MKSFCFSGVPTFFRAGCQIARSGRFGGFANPGRELTRHLWRLVPDGLTDQDWSNEIDHLIERCERSDDEAVLSWFSQRYPRCIALVPVRRRRTFLRGVNEMIAEHWTL